MSSDLAHDGTVIWSTLADPSDGFARVASRPRALTAVVLSTGLSLIATGLLLRHIDLEAVAADSLRADMTPHERTTAIETAGKLYQVTTWALAAVGPLASAFLAALALFFAFWVAGAKATFKQTFTVAAHALVPQAFKALLLVPAATVHSPVAPADLPRLLPSSLDRLIPASLGWPPVALAALSAIDVFTLWSLVLAGWGMSRVSGASRLRTTLILLTLFIAGVAVLKVIPSGGGS